MADEGKPPYPVGYAKPPQATQFKPGQSGNPKGRQKGAKNFATLFEEELEARIPVTENGKRKKITKRRAAVKQVVNKAAGGDVKAIGTILNESRLHESQPSNRPVQEVPSSAEDQQVIAGILDRIRRNLAQEPIEGAQESGNQRSTDETGASNGSEPL